MTSRENKLSLGVDTETGGHYLSIPVKNTLIDYEEYYAISPGEYDRFGQDQGSAAAFAEECRRRLQDDRLILKPGRDRGEPW